MSKITISKSEAMLLGRNVYYDGKPCKYGHAEGRYVNNGVCVECQRLHNAKYLAANMEKTREQSRRWHHRNKERAAAAHRHWREKPDNKAHLRAYHQEWREANPDKVEAYHADKRQKYRDGIYVNRKKD